jgi:putative hydrolase of the HAD superfamily
MVNIPLFTGIKCVVFDVMGVILVEGHDVTNLLIPFIERECGCNDKEEIYKRYREASLGIISAKEFWKGISNNYPEIQWKYLNICFEVDPQFFPIVRKLKKKYLLAILSNDVGEWSKYLRDRYDYDRFFEEIVVSSDFQSRKPDEKIYRVLIGRLKSHEIEPQKCILIDDRLKNLKTAKDLGMKTIHFEREYDSFTFHPDFSIKTLGELQTILLKQAR